MPIQGAESLIYVAEVSDSFDVTASGGAQRAALSALAAKLNQEISRVHGVSASVISLVKPRTIPKTTSGKIARQWVRKVRRGDMWFIIGAVMTALATMRIARVDE